MSHALKRRRIDAYNSMTTKSSHLEPSARKTPKITIFPETILPITVLNATTPQELSYALLTTNKTLFTKQEVIAIVSNLDNMYQPRFPEPCEYIN